MDSRPQSRSTGPPTSFYSVSRSSTEGSVANGNDRQLVLYRPPTESLFVGLIVTVIVFLVLSFFEIKERYLNLSGGPRDGMRRAGEVVCGMVSWFGFLIGTLCGAFRKGFRNGYEAAMQADDN